VHRAVIDEVLPSVEGPCDRVDNFGGWDLSEYEAHISNWTGNRRIRTLKIHFVGPTTRDQSPSYANPATTPNETTASRAAIEQE
jgi:hypothetical protein